MISDHTLQIQRGDLPAGSESSLCSQERDQLQSLGSHMETQSIGKNDDSIFDIRKNDNEWNK